MNGVSIHRAWRRLRDRLFSLFVARSFATFGRGSTIALPARVEGAETISIGRAVYVGPSSWLHTEPVPGSRGTIAIGDRVKATARLTLSAASSIIVEDGVLIAAGVYVSDHGHRFGDDDRPIHQQGTTAPAPVVIRRNAWLGQNVVVMPGVEIGAGAVVGSNAVVTRDVPAGAVVAGVPARVVRAPTTED